MNSLFMYMRVEFNKLHIGGRKVIIPAFPSMHLLDLSWFKLVLAQHSKKKIQWVAGDFAAGNLVTEAEAEAEANVHRSLLLLEQRANTVDTPSHSRHFSSSRIYLRR